MSLTRFKNGWGFVVVYSGVYIAMMIAIDLIRDAVTAMSAMALLMSAGGARLTVQRWRRERRAAGTVTDGRSGLSG